MPPRRHTSYVQAGLPPWVGDKGSRAGRCLDWISRYIRIPSGRGAGDPLVPARYQQDLVETLLAEDAQVGALSIPAGNAKSTLTAAIGLWAGATYQDSPQVPLIARDGLQATRTLFQPMCSMIRLNPVLDEFLMPRLGNTDRGIVSAWNGGSISPLPASEDRLQGLNPSLAIIDEAELVELGVLGALEDRLGKRTEAVLIVIGTPGPSESSLGTVRQMATAGADYRVVEYAAPADADIFDRATWERANPALQAGILGYEAFERDVGKLRAAPPHVRPLLERRFQMFRLGQWLTMAAEDGWLPAGTWEACPVVPPPADGARIVVAIDGTYRRSTAVVGADAETGAVFLLWAGENADDHEVEEVVDETCRRWSVDEIVYYPTIRPSLIGMLDRKGYPLAEWDLSRREETTSTNALWQAITEGQFIHDGSELLAEHFHNVAYRDTPAGVVLRRLHREGAWIDAAMAARMAWSRVQEWNTLMPAIH